MSLTPTTDTHTHSSYGVVYSQEAAPDFKAQDQNLIALNNTALNTAASELGDDQSWAKDGLEDNNRLLGTMGRRYGNPTPGSEQETDLAQERYNMGSTSRMYRNALAWDGNTKSCGPCLGDNRKRVQPSCTANNDLISQISEQEAKTDQLEEWPRILEECNKDLYDTVRVADNVKGLDREDQEFLSETLGKKLEYSKDLQKEVKEALSAQDGGGGSEQSQGQSTAA